MRTTNHSLRKVGPPVGRVINVNGESRKALAVAVREDRVSAAGVVVLYEVTSSFETRLCAMDDWTSSRPSKKAEQAFVPPEAPENGSYWRHRNGSYYQVIRSAILDSTGHAFVVYRNTLTSEIWARSVTSWCKPTKIDGKTVPRFVLSTADAALA